MFQKLYDKLSGWLTGRLAGRAPGWLYCSEEHMHSFPEQTGRHFSLQLNKMTVYKRDPECPVHVLSLLDGTDGMVECNLGQCVWVCAGSG